MLLATLLKTYFFLPKECDVEMKKKIDKTMREGGSKKKNENCSL